MPRFDVVAKFASDRVLDLLTDKPPMFEVLLVREMTTGNYGICRIHHGQPVTLRDATLLTLTKSELSQLKTLIEKAEQEDND